MKQKNYKGRKADKDDLILIFCGVVFIVAHLLVEWICF